MKTRNPEIDHPRREFRFSLWNRLFSEYMNKTGNPIVDNVTEPDTGWLRPKADKFGLHLICNVVDGSWETLRTEEGRKNGATAKISMRLVDRDQKPSLPLLTPKTKLNPTFNTIELFTSESLKTQCDLLAEMRDLLKDANKVIWDIRDVVVSVNDAQKQLLKEWTNPAPRIP